MVESVSLVCGRTPTRPTTSPPPVAWRTAVPHPGRGRELAQRTFEALPERHPAERGAATCGLIREAPRRRIEQRDRDRLSDPFGPRNPACQHRSPNPPLS